METVAAYDAFARENNFGALWMFEPERDRFFLYIYYFLEYDEDLPIEWIIEWINRGVNDPSTSLVYVGKYYGGRYYYDPGYALVFPDTDASDKWFESEPWFIDMSASDNLHQVELE